MNPIHNLCRGVHEYWAFGAANRFSNANIYRRPSCAGFSTKYHDSAAQTNARGVAKTRLTHQIRANGISVNKVCWIGKL